MKKSEKFRKEAENVMAKIRAIARHIRNVEDNCLILGERLIYQGEIELGHQLVASGFIHDASKFKGIEWESIVPGQSSENVTDKKLKLKLAISNHNLTNSHHPEYWGGVHRMPRVCVAEMVCDWKSRSEEFGTSLRDWIDEVATKRWKFNTDDKVYKEIIYFVDLLCEKPFEQIAQG